MKYLFTIILLLSFQISLAQIETAENNLKEDELIIYYDDNWKGTSKSNAKYYRIYTFNNNIYGEIRDYYKSGNIQCIIEGASYIDKNDDSKSKLEGRSTWYFESGNISMKGNLTNGKYDGNFIVYNENGNVYRNLNYENGELQFPYIECDPYSFIEGTDIGDCKKILADYFVSSDNKLNFYMFSNEFGYATIKPNIGLELTSKKSRISTSLLQHKVEGKSFTINSIISHESGVKNYGYGFYIGFKDWKNYLSFIISKNGQFLIYMKYNGMQSNLKEWTASRYINKKSDNILQFSKLGNTFYFSINGNVVFTTDAFSLMGTFHGIAVENNMKIIARTFTLSESVSDIFSSIPDDEITNSNNWKGNGSGIILSKNGYIATNHHVIEGANKIEVEFIYNEEVKKYNAEIIKSDEINDLAIIKIDDSNFKNLSSIPYNFKTRTSDIGEEVFALGYPMALSIMGKDIKFTDGKISSKTGYRGDITTYQTTTPIQGGNSGGPLFDYKGNLIAINSSGLSNEIADNVSYSIKTSYLMSLIDTLPEEIPLPSSTELSNKPLTEQIKELSKYVVLIKVK